MTRTEVNLTEQVIGTLPITNGGTGATSLSGAGIEQTANKNTASGYAGLNSSGFVATAQLGSGTANSTTFLRGDSTYATPTAPTTWTTTATSAGTLTLAVTTQVYVFTGTTTTWTLPSVSGNTGAYFHLESRGSGNITLNAAGADHIWWKAAITSMTIAASGSLILVCDGTYWNALSNDLVNNSVGTLPVANGGTGQTTLTSLGLTTPVVTGYTETVQALGTVGATKTIPALSNGTVVTATLTSATACTFTMPTATAGQSFVVLLKQPASGTATTATFTSVKWPAIGAPTITATLGKLDELAFISDGTNWYGTYVQGYTY